MPVQIFNATVGFPYTALLDNGAGGIAHNVAKFNQMTPGFVERDGFKARVTPTGGLETERHYIGPWSGWNAFQAWCVGYSYRNAAGVVQRNPPAQDPTYPHLYCESCEVEHGNGAWVLDPFNGAINADGTIATNDEGLPSINLPCTAFVDNSLGGSIARFEKPPGEEDEEEDEPEVIPPTQRYNDGMVHMRVVYRARNYEIRSDEEIAALANNGVPPRGGPPAFIGGGSTLPIGPAGPGEMARWVERKYTPSIEALPLARVAAASTLVFISDVGPALPFLGKVIPEPGVIQLASMQVEWRIYDYPDPNLASLLGMMGKINRYGFDGPYYNMPGYVGFDAGTLLFQQPTWQRKPRQVTGNVVYDIIVRALWRGQGWNNAPTSSGIFIPIGFVDTSVKPAPVIGFVYATTNAWSSIFSPSPPIQWQ